MSQKGVYFHTVLMVNANNIEFFGVLKLTILGLQLLFY